MNPGVQLSIEVNTLHEILDELDYYRLLQLDPDCVQGDIEPASRAASKKHHPDRVSALGDSGISASRKRERTSRIPTSARSTTRSSRPVSCA